MDAAPPRLEVVLAHPAPRLQHAVRLLAVAIGARIRFSDSARPPGGPCLHHGGELVGAHQGCILVPERPHDRLWTELLDGRSDAARIGRRLPFDVVSATAALAGDVDSASVPADRLDRHGRLRLEDTVHGRAGYGARPIVNLYADVLGRCLASAGLRNVLPRWPDGRQAAIGLSHDVDRPDKYAVPRAVARGGPRLWVQRPELVLRAGRDALAWLRDPNRDDFWLFDQVLESERRLGLRSTFMFAAMPSHGAHGSRHDVHYDLGWAPFRRQLAAMRREEVEIGLHASYGAYRSVERFMAERGRLEELAQVPVRGLRHHYWHLGPDAARTLRSHEEAGFAYDSSLAFNDLPGLRRAIALPFRPWDPSLERPLQVLQLPVLAMDGSLFGEGASAEAAAAHLWSVIEEVRAGGGLGVLDWHVRTSVPGNRPFRAWGECYLLTLQRLAEAGDLWVTDLGSIERWWTRRESMLSEGAKPSGSDRQ